MARPGHDFYTSQVTIYGDPRRVQRIREIVSRAMLLAGASVKSDDADGSLRVIPPHSIELDDDYIILRVVEETSDASPTS